MLTEKSSIRVLLKFWGVFLAVGFQWLRKRLLLCMSKSAHESSCSIENLTENEVLNDIQTCRSEKHGFSDFEAGPQGIGNCGEDQFGLQSLKNATMKKLEEKKSCRDEVILIATLSPRIWPYTQ